MLPGLAIWLDDTVGVLMGNGGVVRWNDRSPNGNTATATGLGTFTIDPQVLNGHDAIVCPDNGTYLLVADSASLQFGTGDFGIIAVFRTGTDAWYFQKSDPQGINGTIDFGYSGGNYDLGTPTAKVVLAGPATSGFHIVAARGAQLRLAADGVSTSGQTNTTNLNFQGGAVLICSLPSGTGTNPVELAELIAVKGTLSDADLANAVGYLKTKFKL